MPEHTPGLWQHAGPYDSCEQPECQYIVTGGDGKILIAEVNGESNARRIVACVNACKLIPTEQLEANVFERLIIAVGTAMNHLRRHKEPAVRLGGSPVTFAFDALKEAMARLNVQKPE